MDAKKITLPEIKALSVEARKEAIAKDPAIIPVIGQRFGTEGVAYFLAEKKLNVEPVAKKVAESETPPVVEQLLESETPPAPPAPSTEAI